MKFIKNIKESKNAYLISTVILSFCIAIIHKAKFKTPPLYYDILLSKVILAPLLLFGLMCIMILLIGDKE